MKIYKIEPGCYYYFPFKCKYHSNYYCNYRCNNCCSYYCNYSWNYRGFGESSQRLVHIPELKWYSQSSTSQSDCSPNRDFRKSKFVSKITSKIYNPRFTIQDLQSKIYNPIWNLAIWVALRVMWVLSEYVLSDTVVSELLLSVSVVSDANRIFSVVQSIWEKLMRFSDWELLTENYWLYGNWRYQWYY